MKRLSLALCFILVISIVQAETITIVTENLPPFQINENDSIKGVRTEVVRAIADETGMKYKIEVYPWARAYKMALKKKNVLIYSLIRSPEREPLFKWIGKIGEVMGRLYKLKSRKDINLKILDDAKSYMIGVVRNDHTHLFLKSKGFVDKQHLHVLPMMHLARKMLYKGRIDLMMDDEVIMAYSIKKLGLSPSKYEEALVIPEFLGEHYLAANPKTPNQLVNQFKEALKKIKKNGTYNQIMRKWKGLQ